MPCAAALMVGVAAFAFPPPSTRPGPAGLEAAASPAFRAPSIRCAEDPQSQFIGFMAQGAEHIQEGRMGLALGCFEQALSIEPTAEMTNVMAERLRSKGILPEYDGKPPTPRTSPDEVVFEVAAVDESDESDEPAS